MIDVLFIRVEAKEAALKQMLGTVKRDKKKIEETIGKLDGYKMETLTKTWTKVNEYMTNSFSFKGLWTHLCRTPSW